MQLLIQDGSTWSLNDTVRFLHVTFYTEVCKKSIIIAFVFLKMYI